MQAKQRRPQEAQQEGGTTGRDGHSGLSARTRRAASAARAAEPEPASSYERPQRAKRQPLRLEDYQQGSLLAQSNPAVLPSPPRDCRGRRGAVETSRKVAGGPRRHLVSFRELERRQQAREATRASPEAGGEESGETGGAAAPLESDDEPAMQVAEDDEHARPFEQEAREVGHNQ